MVHYGPLVRDGPTAEGSINRGLTASFFLSFFVQWVYGAKCNDDISNIHIQELVLAYFYQYCNEYD